MKLLSQLNLWHFNQTQLSFIAKPFLLRMKLHECEKNSQPEKSWENLPGNSEIPLRTHTFKLISASANITTQQLTRAKCNIIELWPMQQMLHLSNDARTTISLCLFSFWSPFRPKDSVTKNGEFWKFLYHRLNFLNFKRNYNYC